MNKVLTCLLGVLLLSCKYASSLKTPGICLSFDDRSINEWFQLRKLFKDNDVRVTFFITQPRLLSESDIRKLKILEKDGHEIGFHGNMHVVSEYYIKENSYAAYLDNEINKGMATMDSLGFNCVSFAYPYGAKYWFTDLLLLQKFEVVRGTSGLNKEKDLTKIEEIFYSFDGDRTLSAIGIDNIPGVQAEMIDKAFERIIRNNEVLMLFAHVPNQNSNQQDYSIKVQLLTYIITKAKQNNVNFYPVRELATE